MYLIKKYANRKLYSITDKKYVTMKKISEIIRAGEDVSIIDNETGEDLTASIVSNLIVKDNADRGDSISSGILFRLFRKGSGAFTDYAGKYVSLCQNAFSMAEDEIDSLVRTLIKNKEITRNEGNRMRKEITGFTGALKRWISEMVDKRLNEIMGAMNLASRDQFTELRNRISLLENKIKCIEQLKDTAPQENHH